MHGVILRHHADPSLALLPIAGLPLIVRQIEWLQSQVVDSVIIETGDDAADDIVHSWLGRHPEYEDRVTLVYTRRPLTAHELAAAAGVAHHDRLIVVDGDVLTAASIKGMIDKSKGHSAAFTLRPCIGLEPACVWLIDAVDVADYHQGSTSGWGCRLRHRHDAVRISSALLDGTLTGFTLPRIPPARGVLHNAFGATRS